MKKEQAEALQAKWQQRADPTPCAHLSQELAESDNSYLTGTYHCVDCGESFPTWSS
jgi:hypothetical protein